MPKREPLNPLQELQTPDKDATPQALSYSHTLPPFKLSEGSRATFAETSDEIAEFRPGDIVTNQFKILRILGRGSMGIVYKAYDEVTDRPVALKIFRPSLLSRPGAAERFMNEVDIGRRIRHPGIVGVFDVRQEGGLLYYSMEYVRGETLRSLMNKFGLFSLGKACGVIYRICRILQEAHPYVIHCDLSPNNILVTSDASIRLVDFGIARTLDPGDRTVLSKAAGAYTYIAPEQWQSPEHIGPWTDIYSLGVIYFEMLTGQTPSAYHRLLDLRPELPRACEQIMSRTVRPAAKRYRSAKDLRLAVKQCIREWAEAANATNPKPGERSVPSD